MSPTRKRLVCVVEGKGDVRALPSLCGKILQRLGIDDWFVDDNAIRLPRGKMVDERQPSPRREARADQLERMMELAWARPAQAVVVVCDSDDDCPVIWARSADATIGARGRRAHAVMVQREYEAWLLAAQLGSSEVGGRPIEGIRNAKDALARQHAGYLPSVHQLKLTKEIDVDALRGLSRSFDKLVRTVAALTRTAGPPAKARPPSSPGARPSGKGTPRTRSGPGRVR